ncbi:Dual specificity protein phosphatase 23 [Vanrija pseudolonga]|uniref:Dual specificity protein phosphatase 23 n=1 Tax=Vanrija pseudolonga TaxID=143232 RepID=A0AAF0XZ45_9TREE|nr:Dual specificity protein phosphatase 23 [Vanrija pseudolonga]
MQLAPQGLSVAEYKGCLALLGPSLLSACERANAADGRGSHQPGTGPSSLLLPEQQQHVTLVTAAERKRHRIPVAGGGVPTQPTHPPPPHPAVSNVYVLYPAQERRRARFLTVVWAHGDAWRAAHGLPKKEYHITLSAEDDHGVPKGVGALASAHGADVVLEQLASLGETALDHASLACDDASFRAQIAERMVADFPDSYKGYARLAEASPDPKVSALSYACVAALNPALLGRAATQIAKLRDSVSYGAVVTATERDTLPPGLATHLLQPWPAALDAELAHVLWMHGTASRERQISAAGYELPRFFSWLYPGRVAGMSTPRRAADVDALATMGFTHVLTLTEETPLDEQWFRFVLEHVFVPVPNYHPPTIAEMDAIWGMVVAGGVWLVHCGGGVGRAGTVLACLIAMLGTGDEEGGEEVGVSSTPRLDAGTAIALLRRARPRSLETAQQEAFVASWISHRWKVVHASAAPLVEPVTLLGVEGDARAPITALFLIGRPGSGKSWLAAALAKRRGPKETVVISQDEAGSRAFCETQLSRAGNLPPDTLVILDRCNPSRVDRRAWLSLLSGRPCVAVYFDYPAALCKQRLDARLDHPTLRAGRGGNALAQMDREMEAPTLDEGWYSILTIASFPAARQAVQHITPDPPLLKFPRTPHLLNLGASTADDVVLGDFEELTGNLTIEEKIDGANMGISLDFNGVIRTQNRSHWVSSADHAQFKPLDSWVAAHEDALRRILGADAQFPERFILYGEWAVARHSIAYSALPGAFIAFDLYDRLEARFLSRGALTRVLAGSDIPQVPLIAETTRVTRAEVLELVQRTSAFTDGRVEGVYVRTEDDERRYTVGRGKVVRGDFIAGNEHWTRGPLVLNRFARD